MTATQEVDIIVLIFSGKSGGVYTCTVSVQINKKELCMSLEANVRRLSIMINVNDFTQNFPGYLLSADTITAADRLARD